MLEVAARYWWVVLLRGVLSILFGAAALVWPGITGLALVLVFGVYSLLDGVLDLTMSFGGKDMPGSNRLAVALMGFFGIAAGIVAFLWPGITAIALLWVIGAWAIATGILEILVAVRLRKEITNEWFWVLSGLLSLVLGVVLVVRPDVGAVGVVTTIGIFSIAWGVSLAVFSFRIKNLASSETPLSA